MWRFCNLTLTIVALATTVRAAAPHIMLFHGSRLQTPVVMTDWEENHRVIGSLSEEVAIKPEELSSREYVEVSLFWGPQWLNYKLEGRSPNALTPDQANQKGRLYLARRDSPPLMALEGRLPRYVGPEGIKLLAQHGVPVTVEIAPQSHVVRWVVLVTGLTILIAGLVVVVIRKGRQPLVMAGIRRNR